MFMQPNADSESFDMAIECIGLAKNDALIHMFIDYLMGETDGVRKVNIHKHYIIYILKILKQLC